MASAPMYHASLHLYQCLGNCDRISCLETGHDGKGGLAIGSFLYCSVHRMQLLCIHDRTVGFLDKCNTDMIVMILCLPLWTNVV